MIKHPRIFLTYFAIAIIGLLLGSDIVLSQEDPTVSLPDPQIEIPGVDFSPGEVVGEEGSRVTIIPFLGQYISAIYQYGIGVGIIIAIIMIIVAGLQWASSAGNDSVISSAKNRILKAILGIVLLVGSYTILFTINPELVRFAPLELSYVDPIPAEVLYDEGGSERKEDQRNGTGFVPGSPTPKGTSACLYQNYTPGIDIGKKPEVERIKFLGLKTISFNSRAIDSLRRVEQDILSSSDPEVIGYLEYMHDVNEKKVPDLLGVKDGKGVVSNFLGTGIGVSRATGKPLGKLTYDMHVMGLAVDVMTRSNWDLHWGGTSKGVPAERYCKVYERTLKKMKEGEYGEELISDPYNMYDRLDTKISNCLNKFANGTDPFTAHPEEFIKIFERHGFYWGGHGWGNKMRSDGMHFEYRGVCGR